MSHKINRNDLCPCGSGKKYKKCCIDSIIKFETAYSNSNKLENQTLKFIKSKNSHSLLNFVIGLQMQPDNHGKNLRIEKLAAYIVGNLNNHQEGDLLLFKQYLDQEFSYDKMEDIPENLFSEKIAFYDGQYTIFSGAFQYSIEMFRNLIDIIFRQESDLSNEFKNYVYSAAILILELGEILSKKFKIEGNIKGAEGPQKFIYTFNKVDTSFTQSEIDEICIKYQINPKIINDFITEPYNLGLLNGNYDDNPLLEKPIIKFQDKYYFVLISNQATALNRFIIESSKIYNCSSKLIELYHNKLWEEQLEACNQMGWKLIDIKIPQNRTPTALKERIFQFDENRFAYVCYIHNDKNPDVFHVEKIKLNQRINEVITELKKTSLITGIKFLSLVTYDCMGENKIYLKLDEPQKDELRLHFLMHQFNFLCFSEKWGTLSLWKFAKSYTALLNTTNVISTDTLDIYSIYKAHNESFYFGDEAQPATLIPVPGEGSRLIKDAKIEKNNHGILYQINGQNRFILSTKYADYAPLYQPLSYLGYYAICLQTFSFPIWLVNYQAKNESITSQVKNFAEAIGFWLYKLKTEIDTSLNPITLNCLEINIIFDNDYFEINKTQDIIECKNDNDYLVSLKNNILEFFIPFSKIKTFIGSNNLGEQEMIKAILKAFNLLIGVNFSEQSINSAIDKCMPLSQQKMILVADSLKNPMIDARYLAPSFYINNVEIDILLDEIPLLIEKSTTKKIIRNINNAEDKKNLLNKAIELLLEILKEEIQNFDFEFLTFILLELNEKLIWEREYNKIIIPAQIICFGNSKKRLEQIFNDDNRLVKTSLATRCLIEYIAAVPTSGRQGTVRAGLDDIDRLLALMHHIINYGLLSDAIHFKLASPVIGKLNSGRIGISQEFFNEKLKPFSEANNKEAIYQYIESFDSRFDIEFFSQESTALCKNDQELQKINSAFLEDWGISYLNIIKFCIISLEICLENHTSTYLMKESEFIQLMKDLSKIDGVEIKAAIEHFSITQRNEYLKAPDGYKDNEVFPWKYNREFSFARRFIVKYKNNKGEVVLAWGGRNAISAQKQLEYLLFEGRLNNGKKKIENLLSIFRTKKGKLYRNKVKDFLKSNSDLIVFDYEVQIDVKGHLIADKNYGDIDVLAYNQKTNTVYSIECKDTCKAKNIHEMKKEMDNYLGREGNNGLIQKHLDRHHWLDSNKDKLSILLKIDKKPKTASFMLTSEVIPVAYIKATTLPLPIISFIELKNEGITLLEETSNTFFTDNKI